MTPVTTGDRPIALGIWGSNGHQIHRQLPRYPRLALIAFGACDPEISATLHARYPKARACTSYPELLATPGLAMVSLCSPRRCEQAGHAVAALKAGVHVYAEKPCATKEDELDRIVAAAARSTATFHEMAGTACEQPYWAMRGLIRQGMLGTIVQVSAQKSYPYFEGRPRDEAIDGGLIAQNGVHAMRFVEHVTGVRAATIEALQTRLGDDREASDLKMAATLMGHLENGGLFSIVANYLNPRGFGAWGNEMVRIWGTRGMVESVDAGTRTRLIVGDEDRGELDVSAPAPDWLACVVAHAADRQPMPLDQETELHPTRMVLRASANAEQRMSERLCKQART